MVNRLQLRCCKIVSLGLSQTFCTKIRNPHSSHAIWPFDRETQMSPSSDGIEFFLSAARQSNIHASREGRQMKLVIMLINGVCVFNGRRPRHAGNKTQLGCTF